jgi:hypothetical protein
MREQFIPRGGRPDDELVVDELVVDELVVDELVVDELVLDDVPPDAELLLDEWPAPDEELELPAEDALVVDDELALVDEPALLAEDAPVEEELPPDDALDDPVDDPADTELVAVPVPAPDAALLSVARPPVPASAPPASAVPPWPPWPPMPVLAAPPYPVPWLGAPHATRALMARGPHAVRTR